MSSSADDRIVIRQALMPGDTTAVITLLQEYAESLQIDLGFQDFKAELAHLADHYAAPHGALYLAERDQTPLGCVGLRAFLPPAIAELKRLYVRPAGRGHALGKRLSQAAIAHATALGYARLRLDTLPDMQAAQALYTGLGFTEIPAYRFNPVPGTRYMELALPQAR